MTQNQQHCASLAEELRAENQELQTRVRLDQLAMWCSWPCSPFVVLVFQNYLMQVQRLAERDDLAAVQKQVRALCGYAPPLSVAYDRWNV